MDTPLQGGDEVRALHSTRIADERAAGDEEEGDEFVTAIEERGRVHSYSRVAGPDVGEDDFD